MAFPSKTLDDIRQKLNSNRHKPSPTSNWNHTDTLGYFQYSRVRRGWIRVLECISKPREPLKFRLRCVRLRGPESNFTALSYVWGQSSKPFTMETLDETGQCGNIALTKSLHDALQDLCNCEEIQPKTFWVDQLCINQDDYREKSLQVAQMGKVYQYASQVVTYLGPQEKMDDSALDLLLRIYSHYNALRNSPELAGLDEGIVHEADSRGHYRRPTGSDFPHELKFNEDLVHGTNLARLLHLGQILSGSWTTRLWLVQENIPNANTLFLRGRRTLSWDTIKLVCLLSWIGLIPRIKGYLELLRLLRRRTDWQRQPIGISKSHRLRLHRLLQMTASLSCSNPRDKLYAVMGLATDAEEIGIDLVPDYTKSVAQVFTDVSVAFTKRAVEMKSRCSLGELAYSVREGPFEYYQHMPSWVPIYSDSGYVSPPYANANASQTEQETVGSTRRFQQQISFESTPFVKNGILVTQGMRLGFVLRQNFGTFPRGRLLGALTFYMVGAVLSILTDVREFLGDSDQALAYLFDNMTMGWRPPQDAPQQLTTQVAAQAVRDVMTMLERAKSGGQGARIYEKETLYRFYLPISALPGGVDGVAYILLKYSDVFSDRSLYMSSDQRLCLAPRRAQENDIPVILFGGPWIYYVRPSGDAFQYTGWGYCSNCMHGEPFEVSGWERNVETFRLS